MTAAMKRWRYLRRLLHYQQMDFEFAFWQMVYLISNPKVVYKNCKKILLHFKNFLSLNFALLNRFTHRLGAVYKLCRLKGGGRGQKLPILLSKKTTKRVGGGGAGQKLQILRRHSLWTAPYTKIILTFASAYKCFYPKAPLNYHLQF